MNTSWKPHGPDSGNADLQIGAVPLPNTTLPTGALRSRAAKTSPAIQENGVPGPVWHSRGYLPHFESAGVIQHVTFHLADSLPKVELSRLVEELKFLSVAKRDAARRRYLDTWLDKGYGSCILRDPPPALAVEQAFLFFDAKRYHLLAWVVMPNHVHVLFQPVNRWTVAKIVASWKKFTARKISEHLRKQAPRQRSLPADGVWHREYWDRYIRNERHFRQAVEYIHSNPVKAGLVARPEDWRWSSAFPQKASSGAATS